MTTQAPESTERIAAIDVGSNSVHIVIGDLHPDGRFEAIDRSKEMVKLGSGVQRSGKISERGFREGLEAMMRFVALADGLNVTTTVGVATSACREAENGRAFLSEVETRTGLRIKLISGLEEGGLIYAAVRNAIDLGSDKSLIVDIGGGSIELIACRGDELIEVVSVNLGVQRLLDTIGHSGPLSKKEQAKLIRLVDDELGPSMEGDRFGGEQLQLAIGTSGTIEALGTASRKLAKKKEWRNPNAEVVSIEELESVRDALCDMSVEQRQSKLSIDERRADTIHLGAVVLTRILKIAKAPALTLCDASLREGLIATEVARRTDDSVSAVPVASVRQRAIQQLAARYGVTLYAARRVARLATMLFDELKPVHGLSEDVRLILVDACLLYDIGRYVHRQARHKHAAYLIANSQLRGFRQHEVDLLQMLVRYHRRAFPKKKHKAFARLPKEQRQMVKLLSGVLRLAIALERRHAGRVARLSVVVGGSEAIVLCHGRDIRIELHAARYASGLLGKALGVDVVVREHGEP